MEPLEPHAQSLRSVRRGQLCIGCGACVAADPTIQLRLHPRTQMLDPSHDGDARAAAVCPSIAVDYAAHQARNFEGRTPGPLGVVDRIVLAQSTNLARNMAASSGGLIKEV